jgi:hypothetical protein
VAEWQTRQTQNLLSVRTWEFKSPRPHQLNQWLTGIVLNRAIKRRSAGNHMATTALHFAIAAPFSTNELDPCDQKKTPAEAGAETLRGAAA